MKRSFWGITAYRGAVAAVTVFLVALLVITSAAGCRIGDYELARPLVTDEQVKEGPLFVVEVQEAVRQELGGTVTLEGRLEPERRAVMAAAAPGLVEEVLAAPGERVEAGELLLRLESSLHELELKKAEAEAAAPRFRLEELAEGGGALELLEAEIRAMEARLRHEKMQRELAASVVLEEQGSITAARLSEVELEAAAAQLKYEKETLLLENLAEGGDPAEVGHLEHRLAEAEAAVERARFLYQSNYMEAPFSGLLTEVSARPGERLEEGQTALVLEQDDPMVAHFYLPEAYLGSISGDQEVDINVLAAVEGPLRGRVSRIGPAALPEEHLFPLQVQLDNPEGLLRAGMSAVMELSLEGLSGLAVPGSALQVKDGEHYLFIVDNGVARRQKVTPGRRIEGRVEILHGLLPGRRYITVVPAGLQDGSPLRVRGD